MKSGLDTMPLFLLDDLLKTFFVKNKQANAGNSITITITQNIKGRSNKNNKKKRAKKAKKTKNAFRSLIPDNTDSIRID